METFGPNITRKVRKRRFSFNKTLAITAVFFAFIFILLGFVVLKKNGKLPFIDNGPEKDEAVSSGQDSNGQANDDGKAALPNEDIKKVMQQSSGEEEAAEKDNKQEPLSTEEIQKIMNSK